MLSFLKSPPTEGFKDYNKQQIELGATLLRRTSPPSPLFPPLALSPPPIPLNFFHSVVTDPVTNPIPSYDPSSEPSSNPSIFIPTPNLQVQQQTSQQQVQRNALCQPSYICFPHGTILCVLN